MEPAIFLQHVVTCALAVLAAWNTFQPGQIFSRIGALVRRKTTDKQAKPLVNCPACMPSIYGTIYFAVFMLPALPSNWWTLATTWALFVFTVSGLNRLVILLPLK